MSGVPLWHSRLKAAAKALGLKKFSSSLKCKHGHVGDWLVASGRCAECARLWSLKKDADNRNKANARADRYRSKHSEELKRRAQQPDVRAKNTKRQAAWRLKNPEKITAILVRWNSANTDKARLQRRNRQHTRRARIRGSGGVLSDGIIEKLMLLQRGHCACCRVRLEGVTPHLDHMIPLAAGGRNEDSNMQLLCASCNLAKFTKHPIDFMQSKGYLL